jgi:3'(2'), 5'-bisphosphate nucleotidase
MDLMIQVANIARRAGEKIMEIYATDFDVEIKGDNSPVTAADKAAEDIILPALINDLSIDFPIVSEEAAAEGTIPDVDNTAFWLVDPLDGTKEFVSRNGEFTVNIGLIENGTPIMGVVFAPTLDLMYVGGAPGAFLDSGNSGYTIISVRPMPATGLIALVSRSHRTPEIDDYLAPYDIGQEIAAGSSLKFCRVAEGKADLYPRLGRTMEWDTAAAHGVLKFAGGNIKTLDGKDLGYGKPGLDNPHFVAYGNGQLKG